jgi:predicted DNA-binding protein
VAEKMTSIQVSVETKDRLTKLGITGDTYDTIVRRLLDKVGKKGVRKSE